MNTSVFNDSYQYSAHTQLKVRGGGGKTVVGTVVKANIGDLEEEVREGFLRSMSK